MRKLLTLILALAFFIPSVSSAATLSQSQVNAIIALLYAFNVDQQTILSVQKALAPQSTSPVQNVQPQVTQTPVPQSAAPSTSSTPTTTPIPTTTTTPVSKARIEIINPIATKGLNRPHSTSPQFDQYGNPENEIYIGAVVYGEDGEPTRAAVVQVTATDTSQNKTINGTGNVTTIYVNGQKYQTPFY